MRRYLSRAYGLVAAALLLATVWNIGTIAQTIGDTIRNPSIIGHIRTTPDGSTTPALSACGTTPALTAGATDTAGTVTMGTTATGCVITFGTAYTTAPSCVVQWIATPLASQSYVTTNTAITTTQTSTSNNVLKYICWGVAGG